MKTRRKSINQAKNKLYSLQERGARPRRIQRAKKRLERRKTVESIRRRRMNENG